MPVGWLPALQLSYSLPPRCGSSASASMLRAELPVQRNNTRNGVAPISTGFRVVAGWRSAQIRAADDIQKLASRSWVRSEVPE
jgi:hypothetical protein